MSLRPMLAYSPKNLDELRFPVLASPKLDGVRALNINGVLVSRKLKEIPNTHVQNYLGRLPYHGWDGELVAGASTGQDVFHRTTSAVMSEGGTPLVTFWVFDFFPKADEPYIERLRHLPEAFDMGSGETEDLIRVRPLKHKVIRTREHLDRYEAYCLERGYEGVMVRDPHGRYKFGRSGKTDKWLCKVKRFQDAEAEIIGVVEQMRNENESRINELGLSKRTSHKANKKPKGTLGSLVCRLPNGVEFEIGTGMNFATRDELWAAPPIGKTVKFKFQPTGIKDKPRFPVFLGIRED
jgi:DNA ligase-1